MVKRSESIGMLIAVSFDVVHLKCLSTLPNIDRTSWQRSGFLTSVEGV